MSQRWEVVETDEKSDNGIQTFDDVATLLTYTKAATGMNATKEA